MSLLIETVAKEIIEKEGLTAFCSGDICILHDIYDECVRRGMKPIPEVKYINGAPHPVDIMQRVRNGMRTGYLFNVYVTGESILRRISFYEIKGQ